MNTPFGLRLAAAAASLAITFSLFSAIAENAQPPLAATLLAQAAAASAVR